MIYYIFLIVRGLLCFRGIERLSMDMDDTSNTCMWTTFLHIYRRYSGLFTLLLFSTNIFIEYVVVIIGLVIGQFGHCNQDLVNLLLTGRATSNVMDGEVSLGDSGLTVKGIFNRASTGYLSHLESLRYCQVL